MTNRITKPRLESLAAQASEIIGKEITLCNAPHYGGWAVETNQGSRRIMERKSAQVKRRLPRRNRSRSQTMIRNAISDVAALLCIVAITLAPLAL